jgi:hypothetical protein
MNARPAQSPYRCVQPFTTIRLNQNLLEKHFPYHSRATRPGKYAWNYC